ncbi:CotH kinase family protein [Aurantibacter crassamenti]|uniref:CotH kinase family protein n=1 Tax=Aurantibacter crassamenti TaxID=1837375 RepID=UPI0019395A5A|nr:CotH kinase family protein [Aurantibacter crassamenti]MBM1107762.1 CotH kinase family protein [Aurantibacter crassamenti]
MIKNINFLFTAIFFSTTFFIISSCSNDDTIEAVTEDEVAMDDSEDEATDDEVTIDDADFEATDWTTETHSNDVDPDFDEVFEDNTVKRIDIVITEDRWQSMLDDMTSLYGTFGATGQGGGPGGGPGGGGGASFSDEDPIFVPAEVHYDDKEWYRVGVRFKGNSSLQSSWQAGILKLSFKLDFDEFEDDYPQIKNQRFYGFKKLSLKNNFNDKSMLREKVAADVFKNAGLAVSHTAFYTVYVDFGEGPQYFGVYTMVEEVDDTVLEDQFGDDDGNLYKPDGDAASFATGTYDEDEFVKKNNEDEADFTDVEALFDILNDGLRTTDAAAWRTNLESVFDTDVFLNYLAVNTVIQNWDTYGRMTHNYFLYNNSDNSKLTWIPWDNNEALQEGNQGGSPELDFSDVTAAQWPLISYLYEDPEYKAIYDDYVQDVVDGPFNVSTIQSLYSSYSSLVEPYATVEEPGYTFLNSSSDFQAAISELNSHVSQRASAVNSYLNN